MDASGGREVNPVTHWPHAPIHQLETGGAFIVTSGTYRKEHYFRESARRDLLQNSLLEMADNHCWQLQAWAVFSNHYHFIARPQCTAETLPAFIQELHSITARIVNDLDQTPHRRIWHNYWESRLTFQRSYLARLKYVMENPVRHGLVVRAVDYEWCSAAWFEKNASAGLRTAVRSFKTDLINVEDPY